MAAGMMSTYAPALPGLPGLAGNDQDYDAAVASGDLNKLFALLERENGLPAGYLARTAKIESSGNPNAKNPNSSAEGLFQFINSTGRAYGLNSSADKRDPVLASLAAAQLAGDNKAFLQDRLGIEPTAGQLYLAHQQGAGGAAKLLANPDAPAASVVGADAARLNGGAGQTAGQLASRWTSKFGDPAGTTLAGMGMMSGSEGSDNLAGGEGGDRVRGLNTEPYKPGSDTSGNFFTALSAALLSGTRQNPLGTLPQHLLAQQKLAEAREDRRYGMWRDNRDFDLRKSEIERAQSNTDRSFGLQSQQLDLTKQNTLADNARADAAEKRATEAAAQPDRVTTADGSVIELPKGGGAPVVRLPGTKAVTLDAQMAERAKAAKAQGLQEGTPAFQNFVLTGKIPGEDKSALTAGDKAAIYKAEDAIPQLDQTIETLKRAKELNPQTYTGSTAKMMGTIGTADVPVISGMFDQKKAAATREFGQIMSMEAIQAMSSTLKGATTDAEMARFMEILGDPSTPPNIRDSTINRMLTLAERQKELAAGRVRDLKGGDYFKPNRGQGGTAQGSGSTAPAPTPATTPKAAASDRFSALIGGGMSKEQAYAKLREEGY